MRASVRIRQLAIVFLLHLQKGEEGGIPPKEPIFRILLGENGGNSERKVPFKKVKMVDL